MTASKRTPSRHDHAGRRTRQQVAIPPAEAQLLARLRAGEGAAFDEWVRAETPRLLGAVRRILRNEEDARDAVQEAFLRAFRSLGDFAGHARLSTWLHRIAINAALMQLRRRRTRPEHSLEELLPRFHEDGRRADPGPAWPAIDDDSVDRRELQRILLECYDRLPEPQRLILLLRDVEGLDTSETAAVLGIGRDAVKMRLHRARQALRTLVEPYLLEGARPSGQPRRPGQSHAMRRGQLAEDRSRESRMETISSSGTSSEIGPPGAKARPCRTTTFR